MDEYLEYFIHRKPPPFAMSILQFWHKRMMTIAEKQIPQFDNKTILEIGAGYGFIAKLCAKKKINYYGYEINTRQAELLQKTGYRVTAATIPPIPQGEPVQVIWMSHVLEHAVSYKEAKNMLLACYDRLDRDGYVVIIGPDLFHWKIEFWSCDWSHGFPTTLNRVEQLLNETGFSVFKSMHHACTLTNSFCAWFFSCFFRLFPINLIDYIFVKLTKRTLYHSFMHVFGLRQIYIIGKKKTCLSEK